MTQIYGSSALWVMVSWQDGLRKVQNKSCSIHPDYIIWHVRKLTNKSNLGKRCKVKKKGFSQLYFKWFCKLMKHVPSFSSKHGHVKKKHVLIGYQMWHVWPPNIKLAFLHAWSGFQSQNLHKYLKMSTCFLMCQLIFLNIEEKNLKSTFSGCSSFSRHPPF